MLNTLNQMPSPTLLASSVDEKRAELKRYFNNSWQTYESLFSLINNDDAFFLRPERLRHPLIFYYGHTATFYVNKFILGKYIPTRINERLEAICAVGVDEMSWDDLDSRHYEWPSVDEVRDYRKQVHALVESLIDTMELQLPISQDSLAWVILMGCEHERIHLETSSVIIRMLDLQYIDQQQSLWNTCSDSDVSPENTMVAMSAQSVNLAKTDNTYGWDNEYGDCPVEVEEFSTSKMLVSNQEYLQFVEDGGYQSPEFWTEEGQNWLAYSKATMPRFWFKKGDSYWQRNLLNEMKLPLNWPAEVNYLEAKAFCNWRSNKLANNTRLPTEAEWYALRMQVADDLHRHNELNANANLNYFASSCPVNRFENNGLCDVVGNVWQWTESAIDGFSGFKVHPLYDDFSTPTFDGKHNLIKGGSWISTGNEIIPSSRYAFRRHFFQHAGFRYVESARADIPLTPVNRYETDVDVCQQLEDHFGDLTNNIKNFSKECLQISANYLPDNRDKVLDLGCKVGRLSFELAQYFSHVDGVDFSARYIQHGVKLQQTGCVKYVVPNEGELVDYREVNLTDLSLENSEHIHFSQGDACNLKAVYQGYDLIVANKLLETLYDPAVLLKDIAARLNKGGRLIIISDYQWQEEKTPKDKWLSGIKVNGENLYALDALKQRLANNFDFIDVHNVDHIQRVNDRQSMVSRNQLTIWQLK